MQQYDAVRRTGARTAAIDEGLRGYMNRVYGLMAVAMVITGAVAFFIGTNEQLLAAIFNTPLKWVVMFAPLAVVFAFSAMINKMSASVAQLVFWAFAALMGAVDQLHLRGLHRLLRGADVLRDGDRVRRAQPLWLHDEARPVGDGRVPCHGPGRADRGLGREHLPVASSALQFAISVIGVLIFAGLTAYDTQSIKNEYLGMSQAGPQGAAMMQKGAIMGALRLYLDFLNMFMFLLQFMGNRQ